MRLLLVDHGCCDFDHTRVHGCRKALSRLGVAAAVCGPSSIPQLEMQHAGMYGIHLHSLAAASHRFLGAVRDGSPEEFLRAVAAIRPRLLGAVRETGRQLIAEAVDAIDPDVIFVMHAGILTDLAAETGAPVVAHVSGGDLEAAAAQPAMRAIVARGLGGCEAVVAADAATAETLRASWLEPDVAERIDVWPLGPETADKLAAACRQAAARRRG
ncbi:MAG: hypothetical protein RLZZ111_2193 [Planctomycetota bacterium]|jgi:hypothetical protein